MNELALFAGAGGGILGGLLLGWRTVCAVESDPYAASILVQRQNDGILAPFPIWDDVRTFDGEPWMGIVDVVSGGFPCQDISSAGKGAGITGERSGLWKEMARIIGEVRPRFVLVENSPMLTLRGLGTVLGDLATLGYDAEWGVLGADDAGAPHRRKRIWIVANSRSKESGGLSSDEREEVSPARGGCSWYQIDPSDIPDTNKINANLGRFGTSQNSGEQSKTSKISSDKISNTDSVDGRSGTGRKDRTKVDDGYWWPVESRVGRVADGMACRVDRLKTIGNGQVPAVVAFAWKELIS